MATCNYDKGDIIAAANIVTKLEENVKALQTALQTATDKACLKTGKW